MHKKWIYNCNVFGGDGLGNLRESTGIEGGKEGFPLKPLQLHLPAVKLVLSKAVSRWESWTWFSNHWTSPPWNFFLFPLKFPAGFAWSHYFPLCFWSSSLCNDASSLAANLAVNLSAIVSCCQDRRGRLMSWCWTVTIVSPTGSASRQARAFG